MAKTPTILLAYTGGTIGMVKDYKSGTLKNFNFDKLLKHIPEIHHLNCNIEAVSFDDPIDSSNMNPKDWVTIAEIVESNYNNYDGFVILHGSDTMAYTASALSFMFQNLSKPVILTGSQLPIGDLRTDAKENLITSIEIAAAQEGGVPIIQEVCLYFEYKLYRGNRTTKVNSEQFQAFVSPNFPPLGESGVHLKFSKFLLHKANTEGNFRVSKSIGGTIGILKLFPGISREFVENIMSLQGLHGIIIETFGSGNAPTDAWFLESLRGAIKRGVHLVNVTQCNWGSVIMGHYDTSKELETMGVISGHDITTESAVAKMMYLLGEKIPRTAFKSTFERSLRGEITVEQ